MTENIFDKLRSEVAAIDAARLLGIPIERKGNRYWCCCPVHAEKTGSCVFNEDGTWHCFGCGAGGDATELFFKVGNYGKHIDAAHALADAMCIQVDSDPEAHKEQKPLASIGTARKRLEDFRQEKIRHFNCLLADLRKGRIDFLTSHQTISPETLNDEALAEIDEVNRTFEIEEHNAQQSIDEFSGMGVDELADLYEKEVGSLWD